MKVILLLSLISFSNLSFSKDQVSQIDVIQAIKSSLESKDLTCTWTHEIRDNFMASKLDFMVLKDFKMIINENEQPVITFLNTDDKTEDLVTITTNSDLTAVVGLTSSASTIKKSKKNIGTIIKPQFKDTIVKTVIQSLECK